MLLSSRLLVFTLLEILAAAMREHRGDPAYKNAEDLCATLQFILVDSLSQREFAPMSGNKTTLRELKKLDHKLQDLIPELVRQGHPRLIVAIAIALYVMYQPIGETSIDSLLKAVGDEDIKRLTTPTRPFSKRHPGDFLPTLEREELEPGGIVYEFLSAGGLRGELMVDLNIHGFYVSVLTPLGKNPSVSKPIMHLSTRLANTLFFAEEG